MNIKILIYTLFALVPYIIELYIVWKMDKQADPKNIKSR